VRAVCWDIQIDTYTESHITLISLSAEGDSNQRKVRLNITVSIDVVRQR